MTCADCKHAEGLERYGHWKSIPHADQHRLCKIGSSGYGSNPPYRLRLAKGPCAFNPSKWEAIPISYSDYIA